VHARCRYTVDDESAFNPAILHELNRKPE